MVIIYLSSGITSRDLSEQEKRATLSVVREENRHLNNSVMILTYALMNGKLLTFTTFLFFLSPGICINANTVHLQLLGFIQQGS